MGWVWPTRRRRIAGKAQTRAAHAPTFSPPPPYPPRRLRVPRPHHGPPRPIPAPDPPPRHRSAAQPFRQSVPGGVFRGGLLRAAHSRGRYAPGACGHLRDRRAQDFPVAPPAYGPTSLARSVWLRYAVKRMASVDFRTALFLIYIYIFLNMLATGGERAIRHWSHTHYAVTRPYHNSRESWAHTESVRRKKRAHLGPLGPHMRHP